MTEDKWKDEWNEEHRDEQRVMREVRDEMSRIFLETFGILDNCTDDAEYVSREAYGIVRDAISDFTLDLTAGAEACSLLGVTGRRQDEILVSMLTSRILENAEKYKVWDHFEDEESLWETIHPYLYGTYIRPKPQPNTCRSDYEFEKPRFDREAEE